ncbi:UGT2A3 isoform 2 [Pongo abelii]|uniref:UGT2A3 isoform 2 n=1 Tax=Pongo abelii TaxID=9601 RepID=A0A2J8RVV3_PONAB|nr:UGT2A3 isoform 2 [Pongo abelii]
MKKLQETNYDVMLIDPVIPCGDLMAELLAVPFVLRRPTTLCETVGKAEIWLIRTYWDFEFPQPYQPNFEFVGGLHCKPAKALPKKSYTRKASSLKPWHLYLK